MPCPLRGRRLNREYHLARLMDLISGICGQAHDSQLEGRSDSACYKHVTPYFVVGPGPGHNSDDCGPTSALSASTPIPGRRVKAGDNSAAHCAATGGCRHELWPGLVLPVTTDQNQQKTTKSPAPCRALFTSRRQKSTAAGR